MLGNTCPAALGKGRGWGLHGGLSRFHSLADPAPPRRAIPAGAQSQRVDATCTAALAPAGNLLKSVPLSRFLKAAVHLANKAVCELVVKGSSLNNWSLVVRCQRGSRCGSGSSGIESNGS